MAYPFLKIEAKWQKYWQDHRTFSTPTIDQKKPKYYVLDMFPYPSGAGLHVGHPEGYTASDIVARYKRMRGFAVLHPMGWDAFGLPAERYAMQSGIHPAITTKENINTFRHQLKSIGFSYDWDREINTTDPAYYRWTQWIFLQLFNSYYDTTQNKALPIEKLPIPLKIKNDLAQRKAYIDKHRLAYLCEASVNWCPSLKCVLANEEVEEWEAKGHIVERRMMRQWFLRITAYADRLLEDLKYVDWSKGTLELQKNWIGRSIGALIQFPLEWDEATVGRKKEKTPPAYIEIYTTRPDTIFGVTYIVLAPEHTLVEQITSINQRAAVKKYVQWSRLRSERERVITGEKAEKTGCFTGAYARHPLSLEKIPIWIADYVLLSYATGAIMAVPAHDERDFAFAKEFDLPIRSVIVPSIKNRKKKKIDSRNATVSLEKGKDAIITKAYTQKGININSDFLDGLPTHQAIPRATEELKKRGLAYSKINYKLRDWLFARQRYWGEPIPISQDSDGNYYPATENELPLELPKMDNFQPAENGESPLARAKNWLSHKGEQGQKLRRETHTMPQWAGSCWYYLRFIDPQNEKDFVGAKAEKYWMGKNGVDLYIGGAEHAVLHLLYARFWHKFLYDRNYVSTPEPFYKLVHQGIVLGSDGNKMSKSLGNVVNPDTVIAKHGADAFRLYEMFLGPLEQSKPWSEQGIEGCSRFLARVWRLFTQTATKSASEPKNQRFTITPRLDSALLEEPKGDLAYKQKQLLHATIKKVTDDIENLSFNTAIARLMSYVNEVYAQKRIGRIAAENFVLLLSPFAPHLAEELWQLLGKTSSLSYELWPRYKTKFLKSSEIEIVLQVNGKLRSKIKVIPGSTSKDKLEKLALANSVIQKFLVGKKIQRIVTLPDKIVNIVCK